MPPSISSQDDSIQDSNAVDEPPDASVMSDSAKTLRPDITFEQFSNQHQEKHASSHMGFVQSAINSKHSSSSSTGMAAARISRRTHSRSTSASSLSHSPSPTTTDSSVHSPVTPYGTMPIPPSIPIDQAHFSKRPVSPQSSGPSSLLSELLRSPPRSPETHSTILPHLTDAARNVSLEGQLEQIEANALPTAKQPISTRKPTTITFAVDGKSPRLSRNDSDATSPVTMTETPTTLTPHDLLDAAVYPPFDNRPLHVKFVAEDDAQTANGSKSSKAANIKEPPDPKSPPPKSILLQPSRTPSREASPPRSILVKDGDTPKTQSRETSPPTKSILVKEQNSFSQTASRETSPQPKSILVKDSAKPTPTLMSRTLSKSPVQVEVPVKSILLKSPQPPQARVPEEDPTPKAHRVSTLTFAVENAPDVKHFRGRSPPPNVNKRLEATLAAEVAEQDEQDEMDEEDGVDEEDDTADGTDDNIDDDNYDQDDQDGHDDVEEDDQDDENNETARDEDEDEAEDFDEDEEEVDNQPGPRALTKEVELEDLSIDVNTLVDDLDHDADNDDDLDENDYEELADDDDHPASSVDESDFVPGSLDEDLVLIEAAKNLRPIRPQDIDPTFPTDVDVEDEDNEAVDDASDIEVVVKRGSRTSSGRSSKNASRRGSRSTSKDAHAKFQHTPPVFSKPAPIAARMAKDAAQKGAGTKRGVVTLVRSRSLPQRRKQVPAAAIANGDATGAAFVRPSLRVRTSTDGRRTTSEGMKSRPVPISTVEQDAAQKIKALMSGEVTAPSGITTGHQKKTADSMFVLSI